MLSSKLSRGSVKHILFQHYIVRAKTVFCGKKPGFWAQLQVEILPINTTFLIHNFSFRIGAIQEEGDTRSFKD